MQPNKPHVNSINTLLQKLKEKSNNSTKERKIKFQVTKLKNNIDKLNKSINSVIALLNREISESVDYKVSPVLESIRKQLDDIYTRLKNLGEISEMNVDVQQQNFDKINNTVREKLSELRRILPKLQGGKRHSKKRRTQKKKRHHKRSTQRK